MSKNETQVEYELKMGVGMSEKHKVLFKRAVAGIEEYTTELFYSPNNPTFLTNRGCSYLWIGDLKNSLSDLKKAYETDTKEKLYMSNYGLLCWMNGKFSLGESLLLKCIESFPRFLYPRNNLGLMYYIQKEYSKSVKQLEGALKIHRDTASSDFGYKYDLYYYAKSKKMVETNDGCMFEVIKHMKGLISGSKLGLNIFTILSSKPSLVDSSVVCKEKA